jgi:hypothetical protein
MSDAAVFYRLVIGVLVTWRLTHLFSAEDGPGEILVRLRGLLGQGWVGRLFDCFYCLSLWVGLGIACVLVRGFREVVLSWLALSGAACLLERASRPAAVSPIVTREETDHVVLRQSEELDSGSA